MELGKISIREAIEEVLDGVEFETASERKHVVSSLLGSINMIVDRERQEAIEALASHPRAQEALRKHWKIKRA